MFFFLLYYLPRITVVFPAGYPEYFASKDKAKRIVTQREEESFWSLTVREESDGTVFHNDGCVEKSPDVADDADDKWWFEDDGINSVSLSVNAVVLRR